MVRIVAYAPCWNEEEMLPFYLRHYGTFCERIVVYDNQSTDRSRETLRAHPKVEVRELESGGRFDEEANLRMKHEGYKAEVGRADFVIVGDVDEILWAPDMAEFLAGCQARGETVIQSAGYQMVSARFPVGDGQIYDLARLGAPYPGYSKTICFAPEVTIRWTPGCHRAWGPAQAKICPERLPLLHYKFLSRRYVKRRYAAQNARRSEAMRKAGYGLHLDWTPAKIDAVFDDWLAKAKPLPFLTRRDVT